MTLISKHAFPDRAPFPCLSIISPHGSARCRSGSAGSTDISHVRRSRGRKPHISYTATLEPTRPTARTWDSIECALESDQRQDWDGIGLVVTTQNKLVGSDLDQCRDPDTGAIAVWAQSMVDRLQTYTDVSTSGTERTRADLVRYLTRRFAIVLAQEAGMSEEGLTQPNV